MAESGPSISQYIKQECHWSTFGVALILILFYGISYLPDMSIYFVVTPARFLPPNCWFWTLFTFSFYNENLLLLFLDLVTVFLTEKLLLASWGWFELVRFCILVNGITAAFTVAFLFVGFALTFRIELLFGTYIHGLIPLLGGLTAAGRQMMPDKILLGFPLGKIRYKHISFLVAVLLLILWVVTLINFLPLLAYMLGVLISWTYLRFYQKHANGNIGDSTASFTFAGFCPNHLGPPASVVSNAIYYLLIRLKVCKKKVVECDANPPSVMSFTVNMGNRTDCHHPSRTTAYHTSVSLSVPRDSEESRMIPPGDSADTSLSKATLLPKSSEHVHSTIVKVPISEILPPPAAVPAVKIDTDAIKQ